MNRLGFFIVSLLVLAAIGSSMLFVVDQRQFGVLLQLGQIKKVVTEPGLNFKLPPPLQNVVYVDKRLLTLESDDTEPQLTAEKQRVVIDWFVRWRISKPQDYIRNVGRSEDAGRRQLQRVVRDSFQQEVNKRTLSQLLASGREQLMSDVKSQVVKAVGNAEKPWGMDVIDVRITRVDYAEAVTGEVYKRMSAERKRAANEERATGFAEGEKIRAEADREVEEIVADATRTSQAIRGEADAKAAAAYAEAFGKDPAFAKFYRSLDAYRDSFGQNSDVLVLDPSTTEFFEAMRESASRK
ncbi:protease modulator HflC [Hydrogenophaga sp. 5NK40-0174]|uniref:protease modulator HflC n=1 Tax=Hydrogenophaga sp. 5NK40-0174 TaxID=3127649 RepID=UPI00310C5524